MKTVNINFPDGRKEQMLMRSIKETKDITDMLRSRGSLHIDDCQLDIYDCFNEGYLSMEDAITGNFVLSVFW